MYLVRLLMVLMVCCAGAARGESIAVPNHSFELPRTDFAFPQVDSWERSPKPAWFEETPQQQWVFLTGVFKNTAPGSDDHIGNMDGDQALFFFAYPEVAIFQDNDTIGGTNSAPTHDFDAKFEAGKRYELTVDLVGGGGNMKEGVAFRMSLYYRDANSNMVTVAARTVTNSAGRFPNLTNFSTFTISTGLVRTGDVFAGKNIGIKLESVVGFEDAGGYWDVDNVRLTATTEPEREIAVPNDSFESPRTEFAFPQVDSWQRSPKPAWFEETPQQQWGQLTGVFKNTPAGSADHIGNIEGAQALFFFAYPEVAIFQDYTTVGGTNSAPTFEFDEEFTAGRAYQLSAGVVGGGGNMVEGMEMVLSLYYRDANSNMVTVASTTITNTPANFPNLTNLVDFQVRTPVIGAADAANGKKIGIAITSGANFQNAGGYWDIDDVRLKELATDATLASVTVDGSNLRVSWPALAGRSYQVEVSNNLTGWTEFGADQTGIGRTMSVDVPIENLPARFVRVVETRTE